VKFIRLHIIGEGQTEQRFVKEVLAEHLGAYNIVVDARAVQTSKGRRGGLPNYIKAKNDIWNWLREDRDPNARFTTMFDLYRLPSSFPGYDDAKNERDPYRRTAILENALQEDISDQRFIPYIQIHEFEAIIFVAPDRLLDEYLGYEREVQELIESVRGWEPERINDGSTTAPSKRIMAKIPEYGKAVGGINVARAIGVKKIRDACPHFNQWLENLESLSM
jgi:hypothetical protein